MKIISGNYSSSYPDTYLDALDGTFNRAKTEYDNVVVTDAGYKVYVALTDEVQQLGNVYYEIAYNGTVKKTNILNNGSDGMMEPFTIVASYMTDGGETEISIRLGVRDENGEYIVSETYIFRATLKRGLSELSIQENGANILIPASTTAENTLVDEFSGKIAAGTESVLMTITPKGSVATAYVGETQFTRSSTQAQISLADYTSEDGKTAIIPIRLEWPATDTSQPNQVRNYTVTLTLVDYTPEIKTQPVDVTCGKDETATLTVAATAPEGAVLTYQWYEVSGESGTAIEGATEASYTAPTDAIGEKSYYCVVTNTVSGKEYTKQSDTVKVRTVEWDVKPPKFIVQPNSISCKQNAYAALSVEVEEPEAGSILIQWYKDGKTVRGNGPVLVVDTSEIGTSAYYCSIQWYYNGSTYSFYSQMAEVIVDNSFDGEDYTPVIVTQPKSIVCGKGDLPRLSIEVEETKAGTLTYQWYTSPGDKIPGANTNSFTPPTKVSGQTDYYCVVTNTVGDKHYPIRSDTAWVTVNLTEVNVPTIVRDLGSYYRVSPASNEITDYKTEYEAGTIPDYMYLIFEQSDSGAKYQLDIYHGTSPSFDSAELVENAQVKQRMTTGENGLVNREYYVILTQSYDKGEHYFFCKVTASSATDATVQSASLIMGPVKLTFTESTSDFEGEGTAENPFIIRTAEDLVKLQELVATGKSFSGVVFQVVDDITLPANWEPIGCTKDGSVNINAGANLNAFSGTIDGKISSTKNATITVPVGGLPLLGYINGAVVKNLNIYGERIEGAGLVNSYTGVGLSGNAITIENVRLKSGSKTLKSGLVASVGGNGFACASAGFTITIRNCVIEENVIVGYDGNQNGIGSFAGRINGIVENSTSAATVKGASYVGGIISGRDNAMSQCEVKNCTFSGIVEASGSYVGGIVGGGYDNQTAPNGACPTIVACTVTGNVKGGDRVGGIFGGDGYVAQTWDNVTGSISANSFTGKIEATSGQYVGGIIGYRNSLNKYDNIAGNTYSADCGVDKGIGFVKYLDTSYPNPAKMDGTIVINTANGTDNLPTVAGCEWKENHNRTDDPLGIDADKLCQKIGGSSAPVCYELKVSGTYKTEYTVGDDLDLSGIKLTASWTNGTTSEVALKDVTVEGYNKNTTGNQTISLSYGAAKAYITVTVKPASTKIQVSVTILGDSHHSDPTSNGGPHGLARGGLTTWASVSNVEADTSETVWEVLQRVAQSKGISFNADSNNQYGTVYIRAVNGLGEFDNGSNSGWMYTVNGTHPEVGVSAKYVKNGDKIVLHYTDDYTYEEGGSNYGKPTGDAAAQNVDNLIDKIGTVTYTDACKQKIDAARKAYDALSSTDKGKVTKLSVLEAAEKKYNELKQADDKVKAQNVINLINKIGTPTVKSDAAINAAWTAYNALTADQQKLVTNLATLQTATQKWNQLKSDEVIKLINKIDDPVTVQSEKAIKEARAAYDKLTANQKKLVNNYKKLTDAETALAKLNATEEDKKKAQEVIDLIKKLTNVTLESEKDIQDARKAYDALSDLQKKLVENYDMLEAAEKKLELLKALGKVGDPYTTTGDYLEKLGTPSVGSIGGEWMVIGLGRSDREIPNVADYYQSVVDYVRENIDENQRLHKAKSTDNSRLILALTAIGRDVTDVDGHNLLLGLNDLDFVKKQGNNGPIWALLALDSGNYPVPEGNVTRQALIEEILRVQTSDGGWAISGDEADSDMTGMALQALAPYYKTNLKVQQAVDQAIARLSEMQNDDGGFSTFGGSGGKVATSESTSQVIVALTALGINPDTDERFVKNGHSAIDALLKYYVKGGGFKHVLDGQLDGMATEQAYYALTAYYRFLSDKTGLYDMTDVIDMGGDPVALPEETTVPATTEPAEVEPAKSGGFPWLAMVLVLIIVSGAGVLTVTVIIPKFKKKD